MIAAGVLGRSRFVKPLNVALGYSFNATQLIPKSSWVSLVRVKNTSPRFTEHAERSFSLEFTRADSVAGKK
jgi:hypothetical protein